MVSPTRGAEPRHLALVTGSLCLPPRTHFGGSIPGGLAPEAVQPLPVRTQVALRKPGNGPAAAPHSARRPVKANPCSQTSLLRSYWKRRGLSVAGPEDRRTAFPGSAGPAVLSPDSDCGLNPGSGFSSRRCPPRLNPRSRSSEEPAEGSTAPWDTGRQLTGPRVRGAHLTVESLQLF